MQTGVVVAIVGLTRLNQARFPTYKIAMTLQAPLGKQENRKARNKLIELMLCSGLKSHRVIGRLSQGAVIYVGATASVIIYNLHSVETLVGRDFLKWVFVFLIASALIGFVAVIMGQFIEIGLSVYLDASENLDRWWKQYESEDTDSTFSVEDLAYVANEMASAVPFWYRKRYVQLLAKSLEKPLDSLKSRARLLTAYYFTVLFQCFLGIVPIAIVAYAI